MHHIPYQKKTVIPASGGNPKPIGG